MLIKFYKVVEEKGDIIFASWLLDLYTMSKNERQAFEMFSLKSDRIPKQGFTYEISWSLYTIRNVSEWKERGFRSHFSQEIQFCLKKLYTIDFKEDRDVIPDCWDSPQSVWVGVDGGKFGIDGFKKTSKIILKKVENISSSDNTKIAEECWKSERIVSTPQSQFKQFNFMFCLQFKSLSFNRMNVSIVEQTTFLQQTHCDVQFYFQRTRGDKIGAHRCILSAISPVFAAMFQHNMQESKTGEVFIQDIEKDSIFCQLLHFVYSGRISDPLTESTAQQLLAAADRYDIQDLKAECAKFLLVYVNETNASKMFELADAFHVKNLKEECEHILLWNIQTINVLNLIIWADLHSAEKVKKAALDFTRANSLPI